MKIDEYIALCVIEQRSNTHVVYSDPAAGVYMRYACPSA